jgi:hypothetical protein
MSSDQPIPGVDWPEPDLPPDVDPETLSADRARTLRQQQNVAAGFHPLTLGPLHPSAVRTATRDDAPGRPFTCGTCTHRAPSRGYPKCWVDTGPGNAGRITSGPGTDVRAWWPACPDYDPTPAVRTS